MYKEKPCGNFLLPPGLRGNILYRFKAVWAVWRHKLKRCPTGKSEEGGCVHVRKKEWQLKWMRTQMARMLYVYASQVQLCDSIESLKLLFSERLERTVTRSSGSREALPYKMYYGLITRNTNASNTLITIKEKMWMDPLKPSSDLIFCLLWILVIIVLMKSLFLLVCLIWGELSLIGY